MLKRPNVITSREINWIMFRLARLGLRIFVEWNREFGDMITTYCNTHF